MEKDSVTWKRALIAGVWGTVVFYVGKGITGGDLPFLLLGVPLLGLPWLVFLLNDRSNSNESTEGGEAVMTLFAGAFLTLICTLPVLLVFVFGTKAFL